MKNILYLLQASLFAVSLIMVGMDTAAERKEQKLKERILSAAMHQEHRASKKHAYTKKW